MIIKKLWICIIIVFLIGCQTISQPEIIVSVVRGDSMEPTLQDGVLLEIRRISFDEIKDGMIISWQPPIRELRNIKRIKWENDKWILFPDNLKYDYWERELKERELFGYVHRYNLPNDQIFVWYDNEYQEIIK